MRPSCYTLIAVLLLSSFTFADLKIKTRTTVMGHSSESTVYIKGARQRTESSYGGRGGSVTLMQCDQKRLITISGKQCMVMSTGGSEASCPAMPNIAAMTRGAMGGEAPAPRKGGVLTISRTSTDTGERKDMFGYKARHIRSTMSMESSPDACNQSHMKMEIDGWYADLSTGFSCGDESYRALACGGGGRGGQQCNDRIVMKGGGGAPMGFPLKQTTTMISPDGTFTTSSEVVELTNATLEQPLFEMPAGCEVMDMSSLMDKAKAEEASIPAPIPAPVAAAKAPPAAPVATPAASVAPKADGVLRIGVVKIKDMTGQYLPTDNLRINLMSEFARQHMQPIPLDAESPHQDVEAEARAKQCDYIAYTVPTQVTAPGSSGLTPASVPKGVKLDPAKHQALSSITLYKVGKPLPEIKDLVLAADGERFGVDAVMNTFILESDKVAAQIAEDAKPKTAPKTTKAPTAKPATKPKPKPKP
jgi:hypothetical protein